jgi:hypothetical protein
MVAMFLAMLDIAVTGVLWPLVWTVLLVTASVGLVVAVRRSPRRGGSADRMPLHRALSLVMMAALVALHPVALHPVALAGAGADIALGATTPATGQLHHGALAGAPGTPIPAAVLVLTLAFCAYSATVIALSWRDARPMASEGRSIVLVRAIEMGCMAAMVAVMAGGLLV